MNIIQIITKFDVLYGAQKHVIDLSIGLVAKGHKVTILSGTKGVSSARAEAAGIAVVEFKVLKHPLSPLNDFKCLIELIQYLRREKPDLVASHSSKAGIIARIACRWCRIPNTFTAHGWSFEEGIPYLKRKFFMSLERIIATISYKVITVAEAEKNYALQHNVLPAHKMEVIYYGVQDSENTEILKNELFTMVMVAGLRPQKDHITLLKALCNLKDYSWQIFFLGDGELKEAVIGETERLGLSNRCFFLGAIDNVQDYLASSHLMVLTTHWEGLPISILEGLSYSLPIIATDVAGVKEEVIDGYNGFLVRRENVEDVVKSIKYFLDEKEKINEMGRNSRDLFDKKFKINVMIDKTLSVYHSLLNK